MPIPVKNRRREATAPTIGRQQDVALHPKVLEKLDEILQRSVKTAMDAVFAKKQGSDVSDAPAVHTEEQRNRKGYLDDQARETVGPEGDERRRESEARSQENNARPHDYSTSLARMRPESTIDYSKLGTRGMLVAEYMGWMLKGRGDPDRATRIAKVEGARSEMVRALGSSVFTAGGALVPANIQADYIELLYNTSVFLAAGPNRIKVNNGNLTLPKLTGGAQVTWLGQSQNITPSQQTTGAVRIDLRELAVITPASNIFIRDSGPSAIEMIRNDLAEAAAVSIDSVALRSPGTQWQPRGLRGWVPTANTFASSGSTVPLITTDILRTFRILEEAKQRMGRIAIFMSPRTKYGLMGARDGNNNPVWANEMANGTWYGQRIFSTQNIPNNVGTGGNKSEIYVVDMSQQIFAEEAGGGVRLDINDGAAYFDGSAVVSGFSRDETVVRLIQRVDIVSRQGGNEIAEIFDVAVA